MFIVGSARREKTCRTRFASQSFNQQDAVIVPVLFLSVARNVKKTQPRNSEPGHETN